MDTSIFESEDVNNSFLSYEAYLEACENYLISYRQKIRDEMISNYLSYFKLVLAELINCNISDESKIKEIKAKLFKYEKTASP